MTRKKQKRTVKIEVSKELADELERIKESMDKWTNIRISMDTVVKTIIQYYYISIGYPISQWNKAVHGDPQELIEIKKIIRQELEKFAKKRSNKR